MRSPPTFLPLSEVQTSSNDAEPAVLLLQVYNSTGRAFPRRFVLPLHVTSETATGQNLNTRASSQATCVKTGKDTVSRRRLGWGSTVHPHTRTTGA